MKLSSSKVLVCLIFFFNMSSLLEKVNGESTTCTSTFFSSLVQLLPCRPSVSPFRHIQPTEACCSAIKTLGQPCLCVLANGPPISGIDRNMALQLPDKCNANFDPCDLRT